MNLDQLIEEGEELRDTAEPNISLPGRRVDMERFSAWVTKVLMHMDQEITESLIIEGIREHSKNINSNTAYDKLIILLGILKGYKESI